MGKRFAQFGSLLALLVALLLAALPLGARLGLRWVDDRQVNLALARLVPDDALKVAGTQTGWHGWNPQLSFTGVDFGHSRAAEVWVEIDLLESLWRRGLVFEAARTARLDLRLARDESGVWGLSGMPPPAGFDWRSVLWHSNQLALEGEIQWQDAASSAALAVRLAAANRDAEHQFEIELTDPTCGADASCTLQLSLAHDDRGVPVAPVDYLAARTAGGPVRLPAALTGGIPVQFNELALVFGSLPAAGPRAERPPLALVADLALGESNARTALRLGVQGSGLREAAEASVWLARADAAGEQRLAAQASVRLAAGHLDTSLQAVDIAGARRLLDALVPESAALRGWVDALEPTGHIATLDARYRWADAALAWRAVITELAGTGYRGIPTLAGVSGQLVGYERGFRAALAVDAGVVGFAGIFPELWQVERLRTTLHLHHRPEHLALWTEAVDLRLADPARADRASTANGAFRLTIPTAEPSRRLALRMALPAVSIDLTRQFLPGGLSAGLRSWLEEAPRAGLLDAPELLFAGDLLPPEESPARDVARRIALASGFRRATLAYDPDWPVLEDLDGYLEVLGSAVRASIAGGASAGIDIAGSRLRIPRDDGGARTLELTLNSNFAVPAGLNFVRSSPLIELVDFIEPDWSGAGSASLGGRLSIPLGDDAASAAGGRAVTGDLDLDLAGADLLMPEYGLAFAGLEGLVQLALPNQARAQRVTGTLHGEPVTMAVTSTPAATRIRFDGAATPQLVASVLDLPAISFASGRADYSGELVLPLPIQGRGDPADPTLTIDSTLVGLALDLPAEIGKRRRSSRPTQLAVTLRSEEQWLTLEQSVLAGWFTARDGSVIDGHAQVRGTEEVKAEGPASGYAQRRPAAGTGGLGVRITGGISRYDLAETSAAMSLGGTVFNFDRFHIAELSAQDLALGWVNVSGPLADAEMALDLSGSRINGRVASRAGEPMQLDFASVLLPDPYAGGAPLRQLDTRVVTEDLVPTLPDPLPIELIDELPAARVRVNTLTLGAEDYGRWAFTLEPTPDGLAVIDLDADWLGLKIKGREVLWSRRPNETVFAGVISAGDLKDILPRWDYASPVTSESMLLDVEVAWAGSPLNLELLELEGEAELTLRDGRFEDVEAAGNSALRLLSLLNFNAIARRLNLDFRDVFGRGISFEEINARAALDHGQMTLLKPMEVDGTGSRFVLSGDVDLRTGLLDNELVVTLPLTKGLPWYAAYVALANPLAGIGVLLGERVLRKPLEQFSSAKYEVSGTLEEPEVKLVGIFSNKVTAPSAAGDPATGSGASAPVPKGAAGGAAIETKQGN